MSVCQIVSWVFSVATRHKSQAAEAAARFAQEWGRGGNWERTPRGLWKCAVYQRFGARKGTKDVKMEMLQWCQEQAQAVAEAQQRAVVQAFAGWVYMEGAKVENIISTNNIQQLWWAICCWWNHGISVPNAASKAKMAPFIWFQAQAAAAAEQARHQLFTLNFTQPTVK